LTPVLVDISGVSLSLVMDADGRVGEEMMMEAARDGKAAFRGREMFRLDRESGQMKNADRMLSGQVYEKNNLRTRMRLVGLSAAIDLDVAGRRAFIDLNGIIIPVRIQVGPEVNGLQKLDIGDPGNRGEGLLFLDAKQGRVLFESRRAGGRTGVETDRMSWAERAK
jgi:hypothetical protein